LVPVVAIFGAGAFFFAAEADGLEEAGGDERADEAEESRGGMAGGAERAAEALDPVDAAAPAGSVVAPDAYDVSCALRAA
jgi:hypothetical protein